VKKSRGKQLSNLLRTETEESDSGNFG